MLTTATNIFRSVFTTTSSTAKQRAVWRRCYGSSSYLFDITRIGTEDARMSKIVKHRGVVYTSGQTDTEADDSK